MQRVIIERNVPLASHTWFQTGGHARFFAAPTDSAQFEQALAYARTHNLAVFILGHGANILISDHGFDGLVIKPALTTLTTTGNLVTAGAGTSFDQLIDYCLEHNLGGLEEFSGIPGTVGGSIFINIHYFSSLLSHFLKTATLIEHETGTLIPVDATWFNFSYDYSKLFEKRHYVVDATFTLTPLTHEETWFARGRRAEIIRQRARRYPTQRTCGSFFRNFNQAELATCTHPEAVPYAAYYLDALGLKGRLCSGGARVSERHANMIVTADRATSHDVITLARIMQRTVYAAYGLHLQPECQFVGFPAYPLLTQQDLAKGPQP